MENIHRVSRDGMKERARDEIKSVATAKKNSTSHIHTHTYACASISKQCGYQHSPSGLKDCFFKRLKVSERVSSM